MSRVKLQYIAPLVIVAAVVGYLFNSAFDDALQYYLTLEELTSAPPEEGTIVRVAGLVKDGSLNESGVSPVVINFVVTQGAYELPVKYSGIVPDTFHEGGEVVATGSLKNGVFEATQILAKCASKYEAGQPIASVK